MSSLKFAVVSHFIRCTIAHCVLVGVESWSKMEQMKIIESKKKETENVFIRNFC